MTNSFKCTLNAFWVLCKEQRLQAIGILFAWSIFSRRSTWRTELNALNWSVMCIEWKLWWMPTWWITRMILNLISSQHCFDRWIEKEGSSPTEIVGVFFQLSLCLFWIDTVSPCLFYDIIIPLDDVWNMHTKHLFQNMYEDTLWFRKNLTQSFHLF